MRATGVLLSAAPHGGTLSDTGGHGLFGRKEGARGMEGSTYPHDRSEALSFPQPPGSSLSLSLSPVRWCRTVPLSGVDTHTHTLLTD